MYESCFELNKRPFMPVPQPTCYFAARAIEAARQTLARCIERGAGPGLLIGPAGTGKTQLCHTLAEQFRSSYAVALLTSAHMDTRKALLQAILFELDLPFRNMEEGEMRLFLIDQVNPGRNHVQGLVLLVDEAQFLSLKLLEEVRMLSNLVREGRPRVHVVLAGNPLLEERFTLPKLAAFNQRLAARCYLSAFDREETGQYVRSQIEWSGGSVDELFTENAIRAVYNATNGVPRLINQVCDHALILAAAGGTEEIDEAGIEEAWADLQQLPAPFVDSRHSRNAIESTGSDIVEFGTFSDENTDDPLSYPDEAALHDSTTTGYGGTSRRGTDDESAMQAIPWVENSAGSANVSAGAATETGEMFVLTGAERQLDEIEDKVFRVAEEHDDVFRGDPAVRVDAKPESDETALLDRRDSSQLKWDTDPFSETFVEEESIVDHFGTLPTDRPWANMYLQNDDESSKPLGVPLPDARTLASDSPMIAEDVLANEIFPEGAEDAKTGPFWDDRFVDGQPGAGAENANDATCIETREDPGSSGIIDHVGASDGGVTEAESEETEELPATSVARDFQASVVRDKKEDENATADTLLPVDDAAPWPIGEHDERSDVAGGPGQIPPVIRTSRNDGSPCTGVPSAAASAAEFHPRETAVAHVGDPRTDDHQSTTDPTDHDATDADSDDQSSRLHPAAAEKEQRRNEYRQLFARLRRQ